MHTYEMVNYLGPDSFLKWSSHCIRQMEPPLESGFHFKKNGPSIWLNGPFIGLEMVGPFGRPHQKITPTATSPNPSFPYLFTEYNVKRLHKASFFFTESKKITL